MALGQKYTGGEGQVKEDICTSERYRAKTDARNKYAQSGVSSIDKTRNKKREPLC